MTKAAQLMSDAKFYESYARFIDEKGRYETWNEAVDRVMQMHRKKLKDDLGEIPEELNKLLDEVQKGYEDKLFLGAQRVLQFGGEQLLKNNAKLYNCTASYCDRSAFFKEALWLMLSGAGVGFSVQKHHIAKLPSIAPRTKQAKTFVVQDSIEGWADAVGVLLSSFFDEESEYKGRKIYFDLTKIRPKGAKISGGFKAPGPEPLRKALDKIEKLIKDELEAGNTRLRSIVAYDIMMHIADAVISGGVRRAATICLFSPDDQDMITAKTGDWFVSNPQRGRSNNSAVLLRDKTTFDDFKKIMESVKDSGEPGFVWADDTEILFNPCFPGDTLVAVADGRNAVSIKELADYSQKEKTFPVYSARWSITKKEWITEVKSAVAFKTGTKQLVKIVLSNGDSFRCTSNHKLALKDGTYVEARDSKGCVLEKLFSDNDIITVLEVQILSEIEDVYDLTVQDNHNFYIINKEDDKFKNCRGILVHNCVEVGMYAYSEDGESGWQVCNLTEINGSKSTSEEIFYKQCKLASILGTIQASYTDFKYLTEAAKKIIEREALIGVGVTGWMNNPKILFDKKVQKKGAETVKYWNKVVADLININQAARTTVVKPSGNACLTFDGKIRTNKGIKTLQEIFEYFNVSIESSKSVIINKESQDLKVYDKDNNLKNITGLYNNGLTDIYEIQFSDGKIYKFTGNHKLMLTSGEWKYVKDLTENDDIKSF